MPTDKPSSPTLISRLSVRRQWLALLLASIALAGLLVLLRFPAALFIGPMIVAVICGANGAIVRVPRPLFFASQCMIGCLIARSISLDIFPVVASKWPLFLGAVVTTVVASSVIGWALSRFAILPGSTGVWGAAPGGATAMVIMSGDYDADPRLVAFMQYSRVICISLISAVIARLTAGSAEVQTHSVVWFSTSDPGNLVTTLGLSLIGGLIGKLLRLPSPYMLGALVLVSIIHLGLDVRLEPPPWLLAISYTLLGWSVGLSFDGLIVRHAARAVLPVLGAIGLMIAFCMAISWMISHFLQVDWLTAYLATSPGGIDSIAIIAAGSHEVDVSFVMAMQTIRLFVVLLTLPIITKFVVRTLLTPSSARR